jgi:hypothetical protein
VRRAPYTGLGTGGVARAYPGRKRGRGVAAHGSTRPIWSSKGASASILQKQLWKDAAFIPMGEYWQASAYRKRLTDIVPGCFATFYGVRPAWKVAAGCARPTLGLWARSMYWPSPVRSRRNRALVSAVEDDPEGASLRIPSARTA